MFWVEPYSQLVVIDFFLDGTVPPDVDPTTYYRDPDMESKFRSYLKAKLVIYDFEGCEVEQEIVLRLTGDLIGWFNWTSVENTTNWDFGNDRPTGENGEFFSLQVSGVDRKFVIMDRGTGGSAVGWFTIVDNIGIPVNGWKKHWNKQDIIDAGMQNETEGKWPSFFYSQSASSQRYADMKLSGKMEVQLMPQLNYP